MESPGVPVNIVLDAVRDSRTATAAGGGSMRSSPSYFGRLSLFLFIMQIGHRNFYYSIDYMCWTKLDLGWL